MKLNNKLKLVQKEWTYIFKVKMGKLVAFNNKYYQVPKWIASVFHFYYYSGMEFFVFLGILYYTSIISETFYLRIIYAILIFFFIEFLLFLIIPLKQISHWKAY